LRRKEGIAQNLGRRNKCGKKEGVHPWFFEEEGRFRPRSRKGEKMWV
jgi:hypothetical protein